MEKQKRNRMIILFVVIAAMLLAGIFLTGNEAGGEEESIQVMMRDAVLHDVNRVNFFGKEVNPGFISGLVTSGILLMAALIIRIFVIPRFKLVPGKFQMALETIVGVFDGMAKGASPHRNSVMGAYIFAAGCYIFTGTMLELFGIQIITTSGASVSLPAPLSDINGAIMMGCTSYLFIMLGGIASNGIKGVGRTLKEYSLPISMSFRLFGALLSGALVTELVYYYTSLSFVLPVVVGVMFTCLHALIQAYVLSMLVSLFYGQITEHKEPKPKKERKKKQKKMEKAAA